MGLTTRGAALGLVCVLSVALRAYEQEPAPQAPPRFVVGVEVVALDASVVDRAGRPVDGLKPEDFQVTVDGKNRRVASAQFINHLKIGADAAIAAVLGAPPGRVSAPTPAPDGRNVMIVFDEDSLETENGLVARRAALSLLNGLSPFDRVGVNVIPRVRGSFTLTSDRAEIRKTLNGWVPGAYREMPSSHWIGLTEAIEIARMDKVTLDKVVLRECPPRDRACPFEIADDSRQMAKRSAERGTQTLEALRDLGIGLKKLPGPKVLVLVSGGMLRPDSNFDFDAVAAEFAAAEITLYTLFLEKPASSRIRFRQSPTQADDDRLEEFELGSATAAVGGTFIPVIGQVEPQFQRVARELSASYLLAIEVEPVDRDGRAHKISIKVNRSGLDVHGRKQYVIPAPK